MAPSYAFVLSALAPPSGCRTRPPLSEPQPGPVLSATLEGSVINARPLELQVKLSAPRAERSSTAVEDGLMVALIAVVRGWYPVSRHHAVLPCHAGAECGLRGGCRPPDHGTFGQRGVRPDDAGHADVAARAARPRTH